MDEIRALTGADLEVAARIFADAYPGFKIVSQEERDRFQDRLDQVQRDDPLATYYGLFRDGALLGIMCCYDFRMNFLQSWIPAGGVGQLAVDLVHKKEHVARDMMRYFLRHYRERGFPLVALYPFRPDFYRSMGFGYGTKMSEYRLRPSALPQGPSKHHVRLLAEEDKAALAGCYARVASRTHGMMAKTELELRRIFARPQHRLAGCELDGELRAYLVFTFEAGEDFITNDLHIQELIYETPEALSEMLTFLHSQADQIRHVYWRTQDEDLHHLFLDPRNGSGRLIPDVHHETNAQGLGLMYRVVDVAGMLDRLAEHDFGGQTCTLKLAVADSFLPENAGSTLLRFDAGQVQRLQEGPAEVEVGLSIKDLSSLLVGTVRFQSLYRYGLARISDQRYVETIGRLFAVGQKPVCTTSF
jgi:predicted acetyltransferase